MTIEDTIALWPEFARERLTRALSEVDASEIVAFDFDNTCIDGDVGSEFHYAFSERLGYALDTDAFWSVIDDEDGGARMRNAWRRGDESQLSIDISTVFHRRFKRLGEALTQPWAVRLYAGMSVESVQRMAAEAFEAALGAEPSRGTVTDSWGTTFRVARGVRWRPAVSGLLLGLARDNGNAWVVSATNAWSLRAVLGPLGFPPDQVIGSECSVQDGIICDAPVEPPTMRAGKVQRLQAEVGRAPAIAFGDTRNDFELLDSATRLAVLIDRGDEALRADAIERNWLVVPRDAFAPK